MFENWLKTNKHLIYYKLKLLKFCNQKTKFNSIYCLYKNNKTSSGFIHELMSHVERKVLSHIWKMILFIICLSNVTIVSVYVIE